MEWVILGFVFVLFLMVLYLLLGMYKIAVGLDEYTKKIEECGILKIDQYMEQQEKHNKLSSQVILKLTQQL